MIKILKTIDSNLREISKIEDGCWINITAPNSHELVYLSKDLEIPLDFLTYPLDIDERARIEEENGWKLIILKAPRFEKENEDVPYTSLPIGIILNPYRDIIITVCSVEINIISSFIKGKVKNFSTGNKTNLILQIFMKTILLYLEYLKDINRRTNRAEKELQKAMKNKELIKLLSIEKSLVYFTTSLKSNKLMMERLQMLKFLEFDRNDKDLLEDIIIENKQAIEMTDIYSNILSGMMDAFASIISNNLNVVMKILTSITIILMLPTLIASIYGMNIKLPLQDSPNAFIILTIFSLVLTAIGVIFFIKQEWF